KLARERGAGEVDSANFWLHIGSFAVYNLLVGYALVVESRSTTSLLLYALALALHFLVNDYGLRQYHRGAYRRIGRWVLSAAVICGWLAGHLAGFAEAVTASVLAFLTGGILLNTFKEELPAERQSRYWAFALGAVAYAGLLVVASGTRAANVVRDRALPVADHRLAIPATPHGSPD
ncbi:MAG: hypothetical protein KY476_24475, partial [Planctomycetes bacterium]|nr:hypothetical protein [Planctomycetota bacterium]